jgi:hypothetical protein
MHVPPETPKQDQQNQQPPWSPQSQHPQPSHQQPQWGSPQQQWPQMPQNVNTNTNMNNIVVNVGSIPVVARSQRPFIIRAIYFFVIGFWLTFLWINVAYLLALTVIGLPAAQWMFLRVNAVLTLQRLQ